MPGTPQERARILANARETRDESLQIFADCDHWNRCHPDEEPIDCDPDGQLRRLIDGLDKFIAAETGRQGVFHVSAYGELTTTPDDGDEAKQ